MDGKTKQMMIEHIKTHAGGYPVTKEQLVAACENMSEFTAEQKEWFASALPTGSYNTAGDVIKAIKW